jgi:hypothetical protein
MISAHYNVTKYPFRTLIEGALGHEDLEQLHTHYNYAPFTMENNSDTELHNRFMERFVRAGQTLKLYTISS